MKSAVPMGNAGKRERWETLIVVPHTRIHREQNDNETYRGASLARNTPLLGPYIRTMLRALWGSWGGERFLMSEVPLYIL